MTRRCLGCPETRPRRRDVSRSDDGGTRSVREMPSGRAPAPSPLFADPWFARFASWPRGRPVELSTHGLRIGYGSQ